MRIRLSKNKWIEFDEFIKFYRYKVAIGDVFDHSIATDEEKHKIRKYFKEKVFVNNLHAYFMDERDAVFFKMGLCNIDKCSLDDD